MGVTRFPNGIDAGDEAGNAGTLSIGGVGLSAYEMGTVVVPVGASGTAFVPSNLTTIDYVMAAPYSTAVGVAGYAGVHASAAGGTITLIGISSAGTASTASGTATWLAFGS